MKVALQYSHRLSSTPERRDGANDLAGFIDAPSRLEIIIIIICCSYIPAWHTSPCLRVNSFQKKKENYLSSKSSMGLNVTVDDLS
jgi:hypothetical protein